MGHVTFMEFRVLRNILPWRIHRYMPILSLSHLVALLAFSFNTIFGGWSRWQSVAGQSNGSYKPTQLYREAARHLLSLPFLSVFGHKSGRQGGSRKDSEMIPRGFQHLNQAYRTHNWPRNIVFEDDCHLQTGEAECGSRKSMNSLFEWNVDRKEYSRCFQKWWKRHPVPITLLCMFPPSTLGFLLFLEAVVWRFCRLILKKTDVFGVQEGKITSTWQLTWQLSYTFDMYCLTVVHVIDSVSQAAKISV